MPHIPSRALFKITRKGFSAPSCHISDLHLVFEVDSEAGLAFLVKHSSRKALMKHG